MAEDGEFLRPMVRAVIQEFLEAEMAQAVGAEKGERVEGRLSYRSGYYTRSLVTRVGKLELRIPQDRNGRFSTEIFERYQRSEKALVAALTQMVQTARPPRPSPHRIGTLGAFCRRNGCTCPRRAGARLGLFRRGREDRPGR
jgi:Transposase, Mutator family